MKGLRIIRLVALWSLAVNAITPLVKGMTEGTVNTESLKPETVKDAVDLLGKLATDVEAKKEFIDALESKVKGYLDINGNPENEYKKKLDELFSHVAKLRNELLASPDDFGKYSDLNNSDLTGAVETADRWFPLLHSEFWFLFFHTTTEGFGMGGNQWTSNQFGPSNRNSSLHKWLTDKLCDKRATNTMNKGYTDNNLKVGGRVSANLSGNLGIAYYSAGSLTEVQKGLFFLSRDNFYPSNLASTLLFLAEFCREMNGNKFEGKANGENDAKFKNVCAQVKENIDQLNKTIWPLYNPQGNTEQDDDVDEEEGEEERRQRSRRGILNETYKGLLNGEKYDGYVKFMKDNIPKIFELLKKMLSDSSDWTVESLKSGQSQGPFTYGYIFRDRRWDSAIYYHMKPHVDNLLGVKTTDSGSLLSLLECLDADRANAERDRMAQPKSPSARKGGSSKTTTRVDQRENAPKGNTGEDSGEKVKVPNTPQPQPESLSTRKGESGDGHGVLAPADPENGVVTSNEEITNDGSKVEHEEGGEEEEEDDDDDDDDDVGEAESEKDGKGSPTEENSAQGQTQTRGEDTPNVKHGVNVPGEANNGNKRLKLARSGEGNEEEGAESLPSATPGTPTSPGRQGNPEGKGDASKAGKHTNESESNTEQRNGGKNAVVPDQRPGSPKTGNRGPVGPQTPHRNDQTPQRRRTHSQGDNAPKAIREEVELPSESSFSGIHACGILIAACIFTVV